MTVIEGVALAFRHEFEASDAKATAAVAIANAADGKADAAVATANTASEMAEVAEATATAAAQTAIDATDTATAAKNTAEDAVAVAAAALSTANTAVATSNSAMVTAAAAQAAAEAAASAQASGVIGYATLADLEADLAHDENAIAWVTNDPDGDANGTYRKVGESGAGSWVKSSYDRIDQIAANLTGLGLIQIPRVEYVFGLPPEGSRVDGTRYVVLDSGRPLDPISYYLVGAYALQRLLTLHDGAAIKVRRSSDDDVLDIGFTSAGDLDTATLLDFAAGGDAYVTTWYDQSGNGRNLVQASAAAQPRIVNAGVIESMGNAPALRFLGAQRLVANFAHAQPAHRFIVAHAEAMGQLGDAPTANNTHAITFPSAGGARVRLYGGVHLEYDHGSSLFAAPHLYETVLHGSSSRIQVDVNPPVTGDAGDRAPGGIVVGARYDGGNAFQGSIAAWIEFGTVMDDVRDTIKTYLADQYDLY